MDPQRSICWDQHVLITLPSEKSKIAELKPDGTVSLGKFGAFHVNDVIGYPLGTKFEIFYDEETEKWNETVKEMKGKKEKNRTPVGKIRLMTSDKEISPASMEDNDVDMDNIPVDSINGLNVASSENNKDLFDMGNDVQKMSNADIEALKQSSKTSQEIINQIIKSHGSFDKKTIHSQAKYLKRKQKKFDKIFTIEYLDGSALLQYLIDKDDIQRVMDISEETVGMLLNLANIRANGNYICMDETGGLLVYFMMERMFGGMEDDNDPSKQGKIIVLHENEHVNLDLLKYSNYSESFINKHIVTISLLEFFEPLTEEEIKSRFTPLPKEQLYELKASKKNSYYRKLKWQKTQLDLLKYSNSVQYDALILATTLHLPDLVKRLVDHIHGSRPIICYSQFKEVALELSHSLYDDLRFLAPTILETRFRPYQTIRGKLHPLMTMRGGGGYLMSCQRVIPVDPATIPKPPPFVPKQESVDETTTPSA
ncbi:tRNA (adenine(58)-N(1))-methyltransferase non-catalytic subunit TRM6 [Monosporozyma servazzii]